MLSPRARMAKASALAAASMSPSLPSMSGNASAASASAATPARRHPSLSKRDRNAATRLGRRSVMAPSGPDRRRPPEQSGRTEHEHEHQDREDDDVGPAHGDE